MSHPTSFFTQYADHELPGLPEAGVPGTFFTDYAEDAEVQGGEVQGGETAPIQSDEGDGDVVIPEDLTDFSLDELKKLHSAAVEGFNLLYGTDGSGLDDEGLTALSVLTQGIERVAEAMESKLQQQAKREEKATALAARVGVREASAASAPAEPVVPEPQEFADKAIRVNIGALAARKAPSKASAPAREDDPSRSMTSIVKAASDIGNGFSAGQGMTWNDIGTAIDRRLASFNRTQYEQAAASGRQLRQQMGVFSIVKPFDPELVVKGPEIAHVDAVLHRAADESRLKGNSLVASGGWCAPSETIYDLLEVESRDGLFSMPEINISRGGIKFTKGPKFSDFYTQGFYYTEAQDVAGDYDGAGGGTKPCHEVTCPDFEEERLDFGGVCITAGLLQSRGYPEMIARTVRGALLAHDFRMAAKALSEMWAASTPVTMTASQVGTTAPVLDAVELLIEHLRTATRYARSKSMEVVLPFWVRGAVRSDLARRTGVELLGVTDAMIDGWFALRGAAPQYVYGLDDLTGLPGTVKAWPATAKALIYPAGTFVKGASDIITLDTLYDSVGLGTNDYTALFTEEGQLVAKLGHDSLAVTLPICSTGMTGAGVEIGCDGVAVPAQTAPITVSSAPTASTSTSTSTKS